MRVVDTSAWIEWLVGSPLTAAIAPALPERDEWIVPTIVQFELTKWSARESGGAATDGVMAYSQTCIVVPLDTAIARAAAEISAQRRLAMADAIVYATALAYNADLLTCDRHFDGFPGVIFVAKAG